LACFAVLAGAAFGAERRCLGKGKAEAGSGASESATEETSSSESESGGSCCRAGSRLRELRCSLLEEREGGVS
jgi:hypothetical protein